MGNTLYTSAMHGITPPSASELIEVIPSSSAPNTKTRHGRETSDAASGGQRSTSGSIGPNPFEKMFAYERSRPVTSHDAVRPQGQRRVSAEARSRPSTAASGVRTRAAITATSRHLPKHIACLTTPRRESKAALHTTLSGKDPSALAASQAQNNAEVRPSAHSFDWARETSNSKQVGFPFAEAPNALARLSEPSHTFRVTMFAPTMALTCAKRDTGIQSSCAVNARSLSLRAFSAWRSRPTLT